MDNLSLHLCSSICVHLGWRGFGCGVSAVNGCQGLPNKEAFYNRGVDQLLHNDIIKKKVF